MARLPYGTRMRLVKCVRLRVKNLDLAHGEIVVRQGKGGKERVSMVPRTLIQAMPVCSRTSACSARPMPPALAITGARTASPCGPGNDAT